MKREEIRAFLKSGVDALDPVPEFGSGRITEFNSEQSNNPDFPKVWQVIKPVTSEALQSQAPVDSWQIELAIAKQDTQDSKSIQYENIVDECDLIAQRLAYKYRAVVQDFDKVSISSFVRTPFVKKHAGCLTGVTLTFTIRDSNQTNVC